MFRVSLLALALGALVACDDEVGCDLMAVTSVNLTVVDQEGAPVPGATAAYSVDGGPSQPCYGSNGSFDCGAEEAGEFTVRAEAPGYEPADEVVTVEAGECHVVPEALTITMLSADCTDVEMPSIEVTVAGSSGETLENVEVTYAPAGGDDSQACSDAGDVWICGVEERGDFVVTAVAGGHGLESADVTVEGDVCHVVTEHVAFELDWLPD